jgi:hypothetical protein
MKNKKVFKFTLVVLIIGIPIILYFGYKLFGPFRDVWKQRTTPLPQESITILCGNFDMKQDHQLCSGKKDVYGPDFYDIIRNTFRPYEAYNIDSSEAATYDEVEEKIGIFEYGCFPVVHQTDGFSYFECVYDLRGDEEFFIDIIYTYPENAVVRINTPLGNDGEW